MITADDQFSEVSLCYFSGHWTAIPSVLKRTRGFSAYMSFYCRQDKITGNVPYTLIISSFPKITCL